MAQTTQHTPYLPLVGRSDDAFLAVSGWGELRCAPALLLEGDAPTPVALRASPDLPARGRYFAEPIAVLHVLLATVWQCSA
jgi:hypothetical protein